MRNRTAIILISVIAVVGCLMLAAGATAFLGVTAYRALPKISLFGDGVGEIALAQNTPDRDQGILVASVEPDSPAARAGIVRGDILLTANGEPLELAPGLMALLQSLEPGDEVTLEVLHGDEQKEVTLTLEEGDNGLNLGISPCGPGLGTIFERRFSGISGINGARIVEVVSGSPAEQAGLQVGDVITALGGEAVDAENSLPDLLANHQPGDEVTLNIQRGGEESPEREITVALGEDSETAGKAYLGIRFTNAGSVEDQPGGLPQFDLPFEGSPDEMPFQHPDFQLPEGVEAGVVISEVTADSPAEAAGLQAGDVVTAVDGEGLETSDALVQAIQAHKPGETVTLTILRSGQESGEDIEVTLGENPEKDGVAYMGVVITDIRQQIEINPENLPSWFDQLPIPKDFQLPLPQQEQDSSDQGA
jgi:S1-C subfamily serine protease